MAVANHLTNGAGINKKKHLPEGHFLFTSCVIRSCSLFPPRNIFPDTIEYRESVGEGHPDKIVSFFCLPRLGAASICRLGSALLPRSALRLWLVF